MTRHSKKASLEGRRDDAELTVSRNQFDVAAQWLISRKRDTQSEFGEAWARIRSALYAPEFFNPERPLHSLRSTANDDSGKESLAGMRGC